MKQSKSSRLSVVRKLAAVFCLGVLLWSFVLPAQADILVSGPTQSPVDPVLDGSGIVEVTYTFTISASEAISYMELDLLQDGAAGPTSVAQNFSVVSSSGDACGSEGLIFCSNLPAGMTNLVIRTQLSSTELQTFQTATNCSHVSQTTCAGNSLSFSTQARLPVAGTFEFSAASYTVREEEARISIQINRNQGVDGEASVTVSTQTSRAQNAAVEGEDYTALNQLLVFAAGETQKTVEVNVTADAVLEGPEVLLLVLASPSQGASVGEAASLTITDGTTFGDVSGLTRNQAAVAAALDSACSSATGELAERCAELANLTDADLKSALDQIAPGALFSQGSQAMQITNLQLLNLRNRLNVLRTPNASANVGNLNLNVKGENIPLAMLGQQWLAQGGSAGEEADSRWGVFANGRANVGRKESADGLDPGFRFENQNFTLGADYRRGDTLVLGGAVGYASSNTTIGRDRGSLDVGAYYLSQYGNWYPLDALYVDWVATVGKADYDAIRNIRYSGFSTSAESDTGGKQYSFSLSVGSDVAKGPWQLGSYARIDWARATVDAFAETGGDGLALDIDEQTTRQDTAVVGAKASRAFSWSRGVVVPGAFIEAAQEFGEDTRDVSASFVAAGASQFRVSTRKRDANYFNYGFSLVSVFTEGRSAFINIQSVAGWDGRASNAYELGGRFEF